MKGVVFNLLEQVVTDDLGADAWDDVLEEAGSDGVYTAVGTYEHEELHRLVRAAARRMNRSEDDAVQWFGRKAIPLLFGLYPGFFDPHSSTSAFLGTLNQVIHPEVRKLFPGAYAPEFEVAHREDGTLELGYVSFRDLCSFAEGLIEGAADHYGETAEISQPNCTRRGDEKCVFVCRFT